ncbi:TPR repeat-containing protein [Chlorobium limicola DSM 245]|uniref:TPR repeat-containing protein n=1 Tax=Chlorobium limicola (strain DSM 245 / NBRC 103803 / 6330) TaxID=290315 RepID=B3ECY9_CHLL2|nr:ATP-binding protein [Chlorobium limicola]ACD90414.1 TPR repeat-containing protein [Chlorobium limicola DSM 245]
MNKLLKPYTIIPSELYVKRDADRQLLNIINDMGRPGYVLVSRQMGKTNLLLNAKREAETSDDIFIYIDLSNPFPTAKDCFENIIDAILEIYGDSLHGLTIEIKEARKNIIDIPPHKQHENELRKIIKSISGKLVIILDEIDALTKTTYSDRIFSQIRSVYFARVNFPELKRLTYILSGVIEPSEIIKDSKISPFNIGQKIFLNDFEYDEFIDFIAKAQLSLSDELLKYIYSLTHGNPRITWDVCAEIENCAETEITIEIIDYIINKLYLISYDRPPVDNIRELIKADSELRDAIVEIEYKKGEAISDRVKSKLYLAGIINYTNGNINIKNEIIKKAINLEWINSINEEQKGLAKIALEHFENEEFAQCLNSFKRFLQDNKFQKSDSSIYYYYMGYSAYRISLTDEALKYLNNTSFDEEDETRLYYLTHNLKGLLYFYNGDLDESLQNFKIVLSRGKKDEIYARALVNFGSISLKSDKAIHIDEAKKIFIEIINEKSIDASQLDKELLDEIKSISFYNLAQISKDNDTIEKTLEYYKKAIDVAPIKVKTKIILGYLSVVDNEVKKKEVLIELVKLIKNPEIKLGEFDPDKPMNFDYEQFKEVVIYIKSINDKELYDQVKDIIRNHGSKCFAENLYEISIYCINNSLPLNAANEIWAEIYKNKDNLDYAVSKDIIFKTVKMLCFITNKKDDEDVLAEYMEMFKNERLERVDTIDIINFANYIHILIKKKNIKAALDYINLINSYKKKTAEESLISYLIIHNIELNIHLSLYNLNQSKEIAEIIMRMANDSKVCKYSNILGEDGLTIIKSNAESVLKQKNNILFPIRSERKIGRNDKVKVRFKTGEIKEGKYKKYINDIESGKCVVI